MSDDEFELSRRKVLGGLGTVGIASAGAGLGTTAFFNDTESFSGNSVQAGELDLTVEWETTYQGPGSVQTDSGTQQGAPTTFVTLSDVKPGDSGSFEFCFTLETNPAYLWLSGGISSNLENDYEEPEPTVSADGDTNDPGDSSGEGELADAIQVTLDYANGTPIIDEPAKIPQSFDAVFSELARGLPLDGVPWTSSNGSTGREAYPAGTNDGANCVVFDWEIPTSVGNEIQGDSLTFALSFHAVQARHNDGMSNPVSGMERVVLDSARGVYGPSTHGFGTTASDAPSGWESGSWASDNGETNWDGGVKEQLYVGPGFVPYNPLPTFTIGDIDEVSYYTKTSGSNDFYVTIYTVPGTGVPGSAGWYGHQIQAVPAEALNVTATSDAWNEWSTSSGNNQLTWVDKDIVGGTGSSTGQQTFSTQPRLQDLQSGLIDWDDYDGDSTDDYPPYDYRDLTVMDMAFSTGSGWTTSFDGQLDGVTVSLKSGEVYELDLEI